MISIGYAEHQGAERLRTPKAHPFVVKRPLGLAVARHVDSFQGKNKSKPLRFGQLPYPEIYKKVSLTAKQRALAARIAMITAATDLGKLNGYWDAMAEPDYRPMTRPKGRKVSHTPLTDLFLNLGPADQMRLIDKLVDVVRKIPIRTLRKNAVETLVDLYFYVLRPGGKLEERSSTPAAQQQVSLQRSAYLQVLKALIESSPPELATQIQNQLRVQWVEFHAGVRLQLISPTQIQQDLAARQLKPLLEFPLPALTSRAPVSLKGVKKLQRALLHPDPKVLAKMSDSGEITRLIPEWARVVSPYNFQHSTQDFTLRDHLLNVVHFTKQSPYYTMLTPEEKREVTLAALLHDIGKETGPCNLQPIISVDRQHPLSSAIAARRILPSLHYTPTETERIGKLVEYHQILGSFASSDLPVPTDASLDAAARRIQTLPLLKMLRALTEGDIRGVKLNSAWFTLEIEDRLRRFAALVESRLPSIKP